MSRHPQHPKPSLLLRLWRESQTKALAYTQVSLGGIMYFLHTFVNDSHVQSAFEKMNVSPGTWLALATLGVITYCAHGHGDDH